MTWCGITPNSIKQYAFEAWYEESFRKIINWINEKLDPSFINVYKILQEEDISFWQNLKLLDPNHPLLIRLYRAQSLVKFTWNNRPRFHLETMKIVKHQGF